jgi:CheY-like chemotaxis protein
MEGDRERFLAAGFDGYLSKPVNIADLVAAVQHHCDGPGR